MKKLIIIIGLLLTLKTPLSLANNGQVAFSYPGENIVIDGDFSDWGNQKLRVIIDGLSDQNSEEDFKAQFNTAYNVKEKALYFRVEVNDDNYQHNKEKPWYQSDNLVLYFNPQHSEQAATTSMIVLSESGIVLEQPDLSHQFIQETHVTWKLKKKGKKRFYEGKVIFEKGIKDFRSIGFDLMVVDVDKDSSAKYISWGKGEMKQYRSGQLGDLVLLNNPNTVFGELKGQVKWKEDILDPLPNTIKIKSVTHPNFWVVTEVDPAGKFKLSLPIDNYNILAANKIASPEIDNGEKNQSRIVDNYKKEIRVDENQITDAGIIAIPTYKHPYYLYENEGILHKYDESKTQDVSSFISAICKYYNIPGASVALIKDGKIVYNNTFGVENLLTQNPVDKSMLFQAASITKSVFAFIVLRLVDKEKFDLDKPLHKYLNFQNIEHNKDFKLLTGRMVLSHQSGLPNWAWGGPGGYKSSQKTDLLFTPGTQYGYSGEAFAYLGRVIEKVSGKDLNQLLKEEVIDVLDMPKMYFMDNGEITQVRGHYADGRPTFYGMPYEPGVAHTLLTEAKTFAHFVVSLSQKKGLSKNMYDQLEKRLAFSPNFDSPDNLYWNVGTSLGFFVQDTPFGKAIMHGGNNGDFQAEFVLYTEKKMGFVVFTNSNTGHKLGQELGKYLMYGKNGLNQ